MMTAKVCPCHIHIKMSVYVLVTYHFLDLIRIIFSPHSLETTKYDGHCIVFMFCNKTISANQAFIGFLLHILEMQILLF